METETEFQKARKGRSRLERISTRPARDILLLTVFSYGER